MVSEKIIKKAIRNIKENIEKGRDNYRDGKYDVGFVGLTHKEVYPEEKSKLKKITHYEFMLYHHGTKTCTVRTYVDEDTGEAEFGWGCEPIYFGGWGSQSDVCSINQFLYIFKVKGWVNNQDEYIDDEKTYDFNDLKNINKEKTLRRMSQNFLHKISDVLDMPRPIRADVFEKWHNEKKEEMMTRDRARSFARVL